MRSYKTAALLSCIVLAACETEDPTGLVVGNRFARGVVVHRVWWHATYVGDPVAAGESSPELRTVPATDFAYALLTPPEGGRLLLARSKVPLTAGRGETLRIEASDLTFDGDCASGQPLGQPDADFIAGRIFVGELEGKAYDAATCEVRDPK